MGRVRPMALACRFGPTGKTGWPAHAHRRVTRRDHAVAAHCRRAVARPVWLASSLPADEVDRESIDKLLASRRVQQQGRELTPWAARRCGA
jgi:hypothetical protein